MLNKRGIAPVNNYHVNFAQTYVVSQGLNTIYLENKTLFSMNSAIFYESEDTKITLSASNNQQSDLIWDRSSNLLKSIDDDNYRFNFRVFIENYVFEDRVTINHVYTWPSIYKIGINVNDLNFCNARSEVIVKKGK